MTQNFADMMAAANSAIETISAEDGINLVGDPTYLFVDVRDAAEHATGMIPDAIPLPRGFLEFQAHPGSPMYNAAIDGSKKLVVYCASGGRSALAGKTLKELGYQDVSHIAGGITAWRNAGGPTTE